MEWAEPATRLAQCPPSCRWDWLQTERISKPRTRAAVAAWSRAPTWLLLSPRARCSGLLSDARTFCSPCSQFLKVILCGRPATPCLPPPSFLSPRASHSPPPVLFLVRGLSGTSQLCHPGLAGSRCSTALQEPGSWRTTPPSPPHPQLTSKFNFDL